MFENKHTFHLINHMNDRLPLTLNRLLDGVSLDPSRHPSRHPSRRQRCCCYCSYCSCCCCCCRFRCCRCWGCSFPPRPAPCSAPVPSPGRLSGHLSLLSRPSGGAELAYSCGARRKKKTEKRRKRRARRKKTLAVLTRGAAAADADDYRV